jgi:prevent-host-death family protein
VIGKIRYNVQISNKLEVIGMKVLTSVEAQNRFGELLDNAQRETISITRHGRVIAYIVSSETYQNMAYKVEQDQTRVKEYLAAISQFAGSGSGGGTERLIKERKQDEQSE